MADYELVRKLGAGGFGEVWQARGPGGIDVALKFIRLDARGSELELRSLDVMKTIRHPNLAGLFGVWRTDQLLILAMELCDRSLQDRLHEALDQNLPGIPVRELLGYLRGAAEGLDALHDKDVQHRDVKPGNLLLLQKGVKVADFGLAKMVAETASNHTGALTLAYAAPEFFKGETTKQSDQYSLAATYVHLRTGHLLFEGSYQQVVYGHLSVPPDLSRLSVAEQAVLARALAKEPKERWKNCKTFVTELIKAHQGRKTDPVRVPPEPKSSDDISQQETLQPLGLRTQQAPHKTTQQRSPLRTTGWLWPVMVGLLVVVLVSCGAVAALSVGMGIFFNGKATNANQTDKDKGGEELPNPGKKGPKLPSSLVADLGDGVKMEFVLIDPKSKPDGGAFQMGDANGAEDEKPHSVRLVKPYYLGKYVATQEQYQQVTGDNPSWFREGGLGAEKVRGQDTKKFPVENVTWDNADSFCADLTKKCGTQLPAELRQKGYRFALPTEAQWEYACRAGTKTRYFFGDNKEQLGDHAWFDDNSGGRTHAVTEKNTSNPWGLYDMHGNVWQWCADYYDGEYYVNSPIEDPFNGKKTDPVHRVLRGGSWYGYPTLCRAANRFWNAPEVRSSRYGFRVCLRDNFPTSLPE